jgi:hypothetical protein
MSPNSSCPIEPHHSHHPFALSCATTNLISTQFLMQTMHFPLVPPPILTNHTPPIISFYWPPALHMNVGPKTYIFLNPLDHAHVGPFLASTLPTPPITHD